MRLVADESVDAQVVARLSADGHDVTDVSSVARGAKDDDVLALAQELEAVLVTADKDFGELVFRLGRASRGVLLLRLAGLTPDAKAAVASAAVATVTGALAGSFVVVMPGLVRVRHGSSTPGA